MACASLLASTAPGVSDLGSIHGQSVVPWPVAAGLLDR
jgi:hypothetical protein